MSGFFKKIFVLYILCGLFNSSIAETEVSKAESEDSSKMVGNFVGSSAIIYGSESSRLKGNLSLFQAGFAAGHITLEHINMAKIRVDTEEKKSPPGSVKSAHEFYFNNNSYSGPRKKSIIDTGLFKINFSVPGFFNPVVSALGKPEDISLGKNNSFNQAYGDFTVHLPPRKSIITLRAMLETKTSLGSISDLSDAEKMANKIAKTVGVMEDKVKTRIVPPSFPSKNWKVVAYSVNTVAFYHPVVGAETTYFIGVSVPEKNSSFGLLAAVITPIDFFNSNRQAIENASYKAIVDVLENISFD